MGNISAVLNDEALKIYRTWVKERMGSKRLSAAVIYWTDQQNSSRQKTREIRTLKKNIRGLQLHLLRLYGEVEDLSQMIADMNSPKSAEEE
jgi:hypothetical protein